MTYRWQRRWVPLYTSGSDSSSATARARAAQALWQLRDSSDGVSFDKIRHVPCLILLGEPGIGKTYALQDEQRQVDTRISSGADKTLWRDLAGYHSIENVRAYLFENNSYRGWKAGAHRLTMFVDSVDQASIPVEHVIRCIASELDDADIWRLHLRLVCRDHEWSLTLADTLEHGWRGGDDTEANVRVYQLAPLGPEDIRVAVDANSDNIKDAELFLKEIESAGAWALATVPITLEMLLEEPEHLTSSRAGLYERGSRRLLRGRQAPADLENDELKRQFDKASHIAAVMMLSRKHSVDVEADDVYESSSALAVSDLLPAGADKNEERLLRDILGSALFNGTKERTWAHQSFAEFFAALCLNNESVPVKEILNMTLAADEKFPPHLHDILRWLIEMEKGANVLSEVIKRQPMLVLSSDLSHLTDDKFGKLFKEILNLDDPYVYSREAWNLGNFRAGHPSAKNVLLPYLTDIRRSPYLRRFVLDLVERLDIRDIDDVLLHIVLDENEDQVLRRFAARRLGDVGSAEAKLRLKPFIDGRNDDPEDDLKGYALQALWPDYLTLDELFNAISPPKRQNYLGSYKVFLLEGSIVDNVQAVDLPIALKWVAAQPSHHEAPFSLRDLPGKIMRKAWDNIHVPGVMEAFTRTAIDMDARFDGIFGGNAYDPRFDEEAKYYDRFAREAQARRQVVTTALPIWREKDTSASLLRWGALPIVLTSDLEWLIELLDASNESAERRQLADLIAGLLGRISGAYTSTAEENYRIIEQVYDASDRHLELKERIQGFFISMLDDPRAVSNREHHRKMKEIEENQERQLSEIRPVEKLEEALGQMETGETWPWHNVIYSLLHLPDGRRDSWNLEPDLQDFPLWKYCDKDTRERIVKGALSFVLNQDVVSAADNDEDWYDTGSVSYDELHGYLAIFLLLKADANALYQLRADRWIRWSKVVVWYSHAIPLRDGHTDYRRQIRTLQKDLIRRLHEAAPYALLDNLGSLITSVDRGGHYVGQELKKFGCIWDSDLEDLILDMLRESDLSPKGRRSILDFLLAKQSAEALRFAKAQISGGSNQNENDLLVEFSAALMTSKSEFDWSAVFELFQNDDDVGRAIVEKVAEEDRNATRLANKLRVPELVDLFIWVEERYPTSEYPEIDGAHLVGTREQVGDWRNSIIFELRKKGNAEALGGIGRILSKFPNLEWLHFVRVDLEKTIEGREWTPGSPREILDILKPVAVEKRSLMQSAWQTIKRNWKSAAIIAGLAIAAITFYVEILEPAMKGSQSIEEPSDAAPVVTLQHSAAETQLGGISQSEADSIETIETAGATQQATEVASPTLSQFQVTPDFESASSNE